ncbi:MAG TPA: acyl-CoA desaturase [Bacteroidales bacterium]|nr:acyl-CoA desaturase [Bacteroidales bacterium]HRZ76409.1 acyl-CoA desaturase [Bacteroidales bacterium]
MPVLLFIIAHWYLSLLSQTFFLHRYSAHRVFSMSPAWEKFFFVFTWLTQGSSYLSATAYGIMHRMHHAYADTDKDPHSPKFDRNLFAMMWRTKNIYNGILFRNIHVDEAFTQNIPSWPAFDRFAGSWPSRLLWAAAYTAFYLHFATHWWMFLFLPLHFLMGPVHGVIINWFAHKYGYRNFEVNDTSRNLLPLDLLMMGEAYHNNHHGNSKRANFGHRWFELDPTFGIIRLMQGLGIIRPRTA